MARTVEADFPSTDSRDAAVEPRPRPRLTGLRTPPPYRNAVVVMAIAVTMVSIFAVSYTLALGRPTPHDIPAAVVGQPARRPGVIPALEAATGNGLRLTAYPSLARAEHAISEQRIYAALALQDSRPRLFVASAAGTSVARVFEKAAQAVPARAGGPLQIVDLHPLPPTDPQGLVSFYATLAATILGFVTMFQLRAHAESLSLRAWLVCIVVLALVGGLVLALITDSLLQALRGPFLELWAALAAEVAAAALFNSAMLTLIGRWAIIPTWGMFVAIGNADKRNIPVHAIVLPVEGHRACYCTGSGPGARNNKRQFFRLGHAAERKVAFDVGGIGRGLHNFRRVKLDQWIFIGVKEVVTLQLAIFQSAAGVDACRLYLNVQNTGRRVRGRKNQAGGPFVELSRDRHRRTHGKLYCASFRGNLENGNRLGFAGRR